MMSFGLIGVSVKGGNLALVEAMIIPEAERSRRLAELKAYCNFAELVPVYTCNRAEFYYVTTQRPAGNEFRNRLLDFFFREGDNATFEPGEISSKVAFRALRHLYRVTASLDSLVVGEAQILGQIKQSLAAAQQMGLAGPRLAYIFADAFRVAKKVRRETPLGQSAVSMVNLLLDTIETHVVDRKNPKIVLVGAGPMSVKLAEQLIKRNLTNLCIVNRTGSRAAALADQFGGTSQSLESFIAGPSQADVIFTATSASGAIFTPTTMRHILPLSGNLLMIDLAIPRDIDPAVGLLPGIVVRDIAQFRAQADHNRRERFRAVDAAERIIHAAIGRAHVQNAQQEFQPVMASALNEGLAYAESSMKRLFETRLAHLVADDRDSIAYFVRQLVQYTNHLPMAALAHSADFTREDCALMAGFECVEGQKEPCTDDHHPAANGCTMRQTGVCIGRTNSDMDDV